MANGFQFGAHHTSDYNVKVAKRPSFILPNKKMTTIEVPGRNGNLHVVQDGYESVSKTYSCNIVSSNLASDIHDIAEWLSGKQELSDDYDASHFRLAIRSSSLGVSDIRGKAGEFSVTFDCDPRDFLASGKNEVTIASSGATISNPTSFSSNPLIKVTGSGNGTITIAGTVVTLTGITTDIYIDSEAMDCYRISGGAYVNQNSKMSGEFPHLKAGSNTVSWTGGITGVKITPRWWEL